jgi:ABC-type branched-subunit amino acid transport system ATPase component
VTGPLLRVVDLHVAYRSAAALHGVSMAVGAGEVVTVVGPNGAGKSTLLRAISGLLGLAGGRVTGGRIEVNGRVSHVLEGRRVFRDLTVEENLQAGGFTVKRPAAVAQRVAWTLERFPLLAARAATPAGRLSGGEQQLLAIAQGLISSPAVLLLDEPCVGLAAEAAALVASVVAEAQSGAVVVVAEQRPTLFPSSRVVALDGGRHSALV